MRVLMSILCSSTDLGIQQCSFTNILLPLTSASSTSSISLCSLSLNTYLDRIMPTVLKMSQQALWVLQHLTLNQIISKLGKMSCIVSVSKHDYKTVPWKATLSRNLRSKPSAMQCGWSSSTGHYYLWSISLIFLTSLVLLLQVCLSWRANSEQCK